MQIIVSVPIFPATLCREKTFRILLLPMAGIEHGPPAQQASALSITPLPLGCSSLVSHGLMVRVVACGAKGPGCNPSSLQMVFIFSDKG